MAISRLLLPKPGFHFHRRELPKLTRWYSSSPYSSSTETEKPSGLKKSEAAKDNRTVAVKSYMKKRMEMHPEEFSKATDVQNKAGGSWYTLKGLFIDLKEKMLGKPQFHEQVSSDTSDSRADLIASVDVWAQTSPHKTDWGGPESALQLPEVVKISHWNNESILRGTTSHMMEENSSENVVDTTPSELIKMHKYPDSIKVGEPENAVQSSEALMYSLSNERSNSMRMPFHINREKSSENLVNMAASEVSKMQINPENTEVGETKIIVQSSEAVMVSQSCDKNISTNAASHILSEELSDNSKLVKPEKGPRQLEEVKFGLLVGSNRNQKSQERAEAEDLSRLAFELLSKASRNLPRDGANELTSIGNGNHQLDKRAATFVQTPNASSKVGKMSAPSDSTKKVMGLTDLFVRKTSDKTAVEMADENSNISKPDGYLENSDETGENVVNSFGIKALIECIKELPREQSTIKSLDNSMSNVTDQISNRGSFKTIQSWPGLQNSDVKRRQTSSNGHAMGKENKMFNENKDKHSTGIPFVSENEEGSNLDVRACVHRKSEPTPQIPLASSKEVPNQTLSTLSAEEGSIQNRLLIRFLLQKVENSDIFSAFQGCGPILKIEEVSSIQGSLFKDAFVHFKTRIGLQKALQKTDLMVKNAEVVVEATSLEDMPNRIPIPHLIGDPEVPVVLVKNPNRTVKIKQLTHDIGSHQVKEALAFCGSGITRFVLGSSSSVGYVEFETEDAKEKAIAEHSINVLGKQLLIYRIDTPRTTIVRISNINPKSHIELRSICNFYGKVKEVQRRTADVVDVRFKLAEWPNMVNILNSLNGLEVDNDRWLAQPAPIFPPQILEALWIQPDERRHVKAAMHSLLRKIDPSDTTGLSKLVAKYCGDEC